MKHIEMCMYGKKWATKASVDEESRLSAWPYDTTIQEMWCTPCIPFYNSIGQWNLVKQRGFSSVSTASDISFKVQKNKKKKYVGKYHEKEA